ncbi:MAG TPA: GNAT family N-acetyltransferase [Tepidisphaeraceae bacterium]|jgi:ribosomal protein S18 acetylase RimI-like enzyme|nr:GNAT family N-acetyltransferase [Tepidisphaeraceae bacterium]
MEIRPIRPADFDRLIDIDGTIESGSYLHVEQTGEGLEASWKLQERPLREKRMDRNQPTDEITFLMKQIVTGMDDGVALLAEHDQINVATLLARPEPQFRTMRIVDLRVDFEHRREGLASAMIYQLITESRSRELRAVAAETRTDNFPAARFLSKCGFDLAGLDSRRYTNHDLVKEAATLFWYASLD